MRIIRKNKISKDNFSKIEGEMNMKKRTNRRNVEAVERERERERERESHI